MSEANEQKGMHQRRIILPDGRYLIFYTFDDSPSPSIEQAEATGAELPEPEGEPEAVEERRV